MSATGTPTPNLGLRIPLGTDPASVDDINYNSNALDTAIGDIGSTSVADQLMASDSGLSSTQAGMAIVVNGNTAPRAISAGQYLYIKNHSSLSAGGYHATANIANGAAITSSNVAADADGVVNGAFSALNSKITDNTVTSINSSSIPSYVSGTIKYSVKGGYCTISIEGLKFNSTGQKVITEIPRELLYCAGYLYSQNTPMLVQIENSGISINVEVANVQIWGSITYPIYS